MARQVRIQYPGAVYHVMARGDRREFIYHDDEDRRRFLEALAEACGRTGWLIHAYALMGNHYHLVVETPEPNLVAGMSWLQNTYTRRFNLRHKLWGHLFGGRYKAVAVDEGDDLYFRILTDYVHLNPVRAGLVRLDQGLETYPWTSLASAYVKAPRARAAWVAVERGLRAWEVEDTVAGRRSHLARLERRVRDEGAEAGRTLPEGQSLQATLRRGWYFGSEAFRERLLALASRTLRARSKNLNYGAAPEVKEHALGRAEELVNRGMKFCDLRHEDLLALPCNDPRKVVIALGVKRETTVPLDWLVRRLQMGTRSTVSRETGAMGRRLSTTLKWRRLYQRLVAEDEGDAA